MDRFSFVLVSVLGYQVVLNFVLADKDGGSVDG
jgi:hypothetical protein